RAFESRFATDPTCRGERPGHPTHAVLRYRTEVLLAARQTEAAVTCVTALHRLALPVTEQSPLLALHLVVAQARLAAAIRDTEPRRAALLVDCPRHPLGLRQLVDAIARRVQEFSVLRDELAAWRGAVDLLRQDVADPRAWAQVRELAEHVAH